MRIEVAVYAHDARVKRSAWTHMVGLIVIDDLNVDVFKVVFDNCFVKKSVALRAAEG